MNKKVILIFMLILSISLFASYGNIIEFSEKHDLDGSVYGVDEGFRLKQIDAVKDYGNYSAFSYITYRGNSQIAYRYVFNEEYLNTYSKIISSDDTKTLLAIKNAEIERALNNGYELQDKDNKSTVFKRDGKFYVVFEPTFFSNSSDMYIKTIKVNKVEFIDNLKYIEGLYNDDLALGRY